MKTLGTWLVGLLLILPQLAQSQSLAIKPGGHVSVCDGDSIKFIATTGFAKYSWSTGSKNSYIYASKAGTYSVTATDRSGKPQTASVKLTANTPIKPQFSYNPSNRVLCKGDSLGIDIKNKFKSYRWSDASTKNYNVYHPTSSGSVWVIVEDTNGCTSKSYIQYTVKNCGTNNCNIISAWPDAVLCGDHDSVLVEAKSGYSSYEWLDRVSGRIRTIKYPGTYILKAKDASGNYCYDTLVVTKESLPKIDIKAIPNSTEICKGDSIKLYVQGDYKSVSWSSGSKNWYTYVKPDKTKGYYVEVVGKNGCKAIEDIKITVKENCDSCDVLPFHKNTSLCKDGDSLYLEANSGYKSYHWSTGSTDRVIVVKKAGWYTIEAITKGGDTCKGKIQIVKGGKKLTLNSQPNPAVVCPGTQVVVWANSGFKHYYWNTGEKDQLYIRYTAKESKNIAVEAVDSFGCESRAELKITVKDTCDDDCDDLIGIGKKRVLCGEHDSIALEAKSGYSSYVWSTKATGRVIWVKKAGWYKVTAKTSKGKTCVDSIYIAQGGKMKLSIDIIPSRGICIGDTVIAKVADGFSAYWWNTGGRYRIIEFIATARKKLVIEAVDSFGCEYRAEKVVEADSCHLSAEKLRTTKIQVYPNPASNSVFVSCEEKPLMIQVIDILGSEVRRIEDCRKVQHISLKGIKNGNYFVKVTFEKGSFTQRLIVD